MGFPIMHLRTSVNASFLLMKMQQLKIYSLSCAAWPSTGTLLKSALSVSTQPESHSLLPLRKKRTIRRTWRKLI